MSCIQLDRPLPAPNYFSNFECFDVARLGQRAEGRYDLVAVLATTHHEQPSRSPSAEEHVCSICNSSDSIHYVSERNGSHFLPWSIRSTQRAIPRILGGPTLPRDE